MESHGIIFHPKGCSHGVVFLLQFLSIKGTPLRHVFLNLVLSCGMAAALEKHILAAQKFLGTVRHLPSFSEARDKQVENVLKKLQKSPLHVEQAAALVERLDSSIWGSHVDVLKSAVVLEDALEKKNTPLQDYLALPHYLTTGLWKSLSEDTRGVALEKLCKHGKLLGLTNASEASQAMILLLVFDLEGKMLGTQQWQVTLREKGNVQRCLKQSAVQSQLPHLLLLPHSQEECPAELLTRAFGNDVPVPCQWPYEDLLRRARDWPMRSTHRLAQSSTGDRIPLVPSALAHAGGSEMMQQMGSFVAGFLQVQKPSEEVMLPGFKLSSKTDLPPAPPVATVPVLALEDKKEEPVSSAAELQQSGDAAPSGQGAVAATLAALQADVQPEGKSSKSPKKSGMRKPASVSKVLKKRPAASMRRPAAAAMPPADEGESRDARRERLIKERVPKDMQRKYRGGCSKCYYRKGCTLSCWTYRGYNMKE